MGSEPEDVLAHADDVKREAEAVRQQAEGVRQEAEGVRQEVEGVRQEVDTLTGQHRKLHQSRWALVFVILAWLTITILGFIRVEHLVNENNHRIAADAALSRRLDKIDARETKAVAVALASRTATVGAVVCNEQNRVKRAVRLLIQVELQREERATSEPAAHTARHSANRLPVLARVVIP